MHACMYVVRGWGPVQRCLCRRGKPRRAQLKTCRKGRFDAASGCSTALHAAAWRRRATPPHQRPLGAMPDTSPADGWRVHPAAVFKKHLFSPALCPQVQAPHAASSQQALVRGGGGAGVRAFRQGRFSGASPHVEARQAASSHQPLRMAAGDGWTGSRGCRCSPAANYQRD